MREELGLYTLAIALHKDIDEIKSWPADKILRWSIALKIMSEEVNKAVSSSEPSGSSKRHLFVFR